MYTLLAKPTVEKDLRAIRPEDLAVLNDKIKTTDRLLHISRPRMRLDSQSGIKSYYFYSDHD